MRPGELCALTWEDIDFENKVINVKHSVFFVKDTYFSLHNLGMNS